MLWIKGLEHLEKWSKAIAPSGAPPEELYDITSRDAESTCFKGGSRTSCDMIIFGVFGANLGRKRSHHVMDAQGKKKHININKCAGLSRDWVGGKIMFVCFLRSFLVGENKQHINKIHPKIPGQSREMFVNVYVCFLFFAPRCFLLTQGPASLMNNFSNGALCVLTVRMTQYMRAMEAWIESDSTRMSLDTARYSATPTECPQHTVRQRWWRSSVSRARKRYEILPWTR